jgi:hypothetical protein
MIERTIFEHFTHCADGHLNSGWMRGNVMRKKLCWIFVNLTTALCAVAQIPATTGNQVRAQVTQLTIEAGSVTVLHLCPGYVSSIRLPEDVSSIVVGDSRAFKAEHADGEPRLVFIKPLSAKPSQTNALITTKSGHEVPLQLISGGQADTGQVDFLLDYELPHSFLIPDGRPSFAISETFDSGSGDLQPSPKQDKGIAAALNAQARLSDPDWHGKALQVAVGQIAQHGSQIIVPFSVLNTSGSTVDLLPPQIQLSGPAKGRGSKIKAEPVPIESYLLPTRKLDPGKRIDGVVVVERPAFKESSEQLLLQIADAAQVDRPVSAPIPFTAQR